MKTAILSFSFLNKEHIDRLKKLGEVVEYQFTNKLEDAIERLKNVDVVIADCWDVPMNKDFFENIPSVKYISLNSTGYNQVDLQSAKDREVLIANVPGFSTEAVAEQTFGLILAVARKIPTGNIQMHKTPFQVDPANRNHDTYQGLGLKGKTLGIFGLGQIGQRVAEIAHAFGMKVIGTNRTQKNLPNVTNVDFGTLVKESNVLSINSAFVPEMKNLFNAEVLSQMKKGAILVNTARGDFVDEMALEEAIKNNKLFGYGADVLVDWSSNNPLLKLDNVVLTPHSAFFTDESIKNMAEIIVKNIESFADGKPQNVVNN